MLKEPLRLGVCLFHNRLLAEAFNSLSAESLGKGVGGAGAGQAPPACWLAGSVHEWQCLLSAKDVCYLVNK